MSQGEKINLANRKNRIGKSLLDTELKRINREQMIEMRMHNNTKQRFKNKYSKLDVFDENKGSEASDVVMYETHNPGFCYRRNGDCRLPQSNITSSSVGIEDLHILLFTDGEVDIDKVLCLYLLIAHKSETLTPPPKSEVQGFLTRELSPLERLVDRSIKRTYDSRLIKDLPLYIIDTSCSCGRETMRDPRLLGKIMINDKIVQMVASVKAALDSSNPEVVGKFLTTVHSKELIRNVMAKPKMREFYGNLHGQNIISNCESFHLETIPDDKIIPIELGLDGIDDLIIILRRNILQMPNSRSWRQFYKSLELAKDPSDSSIDLQLGRSLVREEMLTPSLASIKHNMMVSSCEEVEFVLDYDELVDNDDAKARTFPSIVPPKILKNLQKGFSAVPLDKLMKSEATEEKGEKMEFVQLASLLSQKVRKEARRDYNRTMARKLSTQKLKEVEEEPRPIPSKFSLRQTICQACLQRWKNPLPTPKLSKLHKMPMPALKDTSYFSSRSAQKISKLIDNEVQQFAMEDEQTQKSCSSNTMRGIALDNSIEIIDLDELDLAKIRQEIRENETKKKLKLFLTRKEMQLQ